MYLESSEYGIVGGKWYRNEASKLASDAGFITLENDVRSATGTTELSSNLEELDDDYLYSLSMCGG